MKKLTEIFLKESSLTEQSPRRQMCKLAYCIAFTAPLPAHPTERPEIMFGSLVATYAKEVLGEINEHAAIRAREALDLIERLYVHRVGMVFPRISGKTDYVPLVLTKDKLAPIYLEELGEIIDEDGDVSLYGDWLIAAEALFKGV